MKRTKSWLLILGALTLCAAPAPSQDWSKLARLKPGTLIQVHSVGNPFGPDDRCRVDDVDAAALRCMWDGDGTTQLVFPADRVAAVYQVRHAGLGAPPWVALGALGLAIAGAATGNPIAVLLGVLGALAELNETIKRDIGPLREKLKLVYLR